MAINGINPSIPASAGAPPNIGGSGKNPQLAALEQKLQRLNNEKEKAIRNKDKEKERKLEQEIQAVKQKIAQLKQKEKKEQEKDNPESSALPNEPFPVSGLGDTVNQYA
ncbi:MAG: hypothetical protein HFG54_12130 [Lachnospiraceae bacterium]|jgi:ATP-dependent Clp protease ATP-binding subunit ClpA|nr:hypothetical protein [Lachnospiraceae bacterium]